jgi:predicted NAD/FAD-dependent oxidoreductase
VVPVRAAASQLREAASIARHGAGQMEANQRAVLQAVDDARADGFGSAATTITMPWRHAGDRVARPDGGAEPFTYIRHQLSMFAGADADIASKIDAATRGLDKIWFTAPDDQMASHAMPASAAHDIPLGVTVLCLPGPRGGP